MALVENIQRQDLDPIEIALSYQRLIDEIKLTQEQMSERVGKKRSNTTYKIEAGKDKIIIWDVLKDRENLKGNNFVFKIKFLQKNNKKKTWRS